MLLLTAYEGVFFLTDGEQPQQTAWSRRIDSEWLGEQLEDEWVRGFHHQRAAEAHALRVQRNASLRALFRRLRREG